MAGFDRIKPPSQRLEERDEARAPDSGAADRAGRAALFSAVGPPTTEPPRPQPGPDPQSPADRTAGQEEPEPSESQDPRLPSGPSLLRVECSHCGVECPMPLGTAVKRAFPLTLVLPTRSHPVFATCPCGERRTWLKPSVGLPR